jgi:hypothetical protein
MDSPSFLDVNGQGWARRGGLTGFFGLVWTGFVDQQLHDAVVIALIEHVGCVHHAHPGGHALVLIDNDLHGRSVMGACHNPTIASMRPDATELQVVRGISEM